MLFEVVEDETETTVLPRAGTGDVAHYGAALALPLFAFAAGQTGEPITGSVVVTLGWIGLFFASRHHLTHLACRGTRRRWLEKGVVMPKAGRRGYRDPAGPPALVDGKETPPTKVRVVSAKTSIRINDGSAEHPEWRSIPARTLHVVADGVAYMVGRCEGEDDGDTLADALGVDHDVLDFYAPLPAMDGVLLLLFVVLVATGLAVVGMITRVAPVVLGLGAVALHALLAAVVLWRWRGRARANGEAFFAALDREG